MTDPARRRPGGSENAPRPASAPDSFRRNLGWSAAAHVVLLGGAALGLGLDRGTGLAPPSAAFIELGMSGPSPNPGLGSPAAAAAPEREPPAPPPEETPEPPPPEPEPAVEAPPESRPEVVRPTVENRDRMPTPDARERRRRARPERPESGLRGRDAAWAGSARLETRRPLDTSSRPSRRTPARNAGSGAGGVGLGGAPGGTRFDQDFEYSFYQRQMIARIQANWQQIPVRGEARVVVRFTILRDGTISGTEVESSSGQPLLDRAAVRAVALAEPMPRLPDSYPRDRVGVHLLFTYSQPAAGSNDFGATGDP